MLLLRLSCLLCLFTADIQASSHWVVTETGLIRSKEESPFVLAKPFDLLAFMNQEIRWQNIFNIYDELLSRKTIISSLWSEFEDQSHFSTYIAKNEHCQVTDDMETLNWYTSFMEDGMNMGIPEREFMLYAIEEFADSEVPNCKKISSLTYSMSTFEHLQGIINRGRLNATPEKILPAIFAKGKTINQYGHWLSEMLRRNTTSWLHYNLAAIFWRINGNVPKALECSRRAVHHAPRYYKAIPLLCMGSILHHSKKIEDAIVVLGAAVDHAPSFPYSHFILAKAYAVIGDFNSSLKHLNTSLSLREDFDLAAKYYKAVLCHSDMFTKMQYTERTFQKLLKEFDEFKEIEGLWFKIQAALLKNMKHEKEYDYHDVESNCIKIEELTRLKIDELLIDRAKISVSHFLRLNPTYNETWKVEKGVNILSIAYELEKAVQLTVIKFGLPSKDYKASVQIPKNKTEILKEIGPMPSFPSIFSKAIKYKFESEMEDSENTKTSFKVPANEENSEIEILKRAENGKVLYPSNMKVNRNREDFDTDSDWPSNVFCQHAKANFPDYIDTIYPVFMPFEHKGISLKKMLTDRIGVSELEEHELPWHPPMCPADRELTMYTSKKGIKFQLLNEAIATELLRHKLMAYVSHENYDVIKNMQDAEIGQRIHTAIQKKLASKWVLYTLASLYWRVRGNTVNALNCLLTASRTADTRYRDVVLVSLGSVFLDMGLWDESLVVADEAYKLSPYEPPTNFLLAQIHAVRKNTQSVLVHLKQTLRVSPHYMDGYTRRLLHAWACIMKQINTLRDLGVKAAEFEAESELCSDTEAGHSMVCERDGSNCRITNRQCQSSYEEESSAILRAMELRQDHLLKASLVPIWHKYETTFAKILNHKPKVRHHKAGHQKSFEMMKNMYRDLVAECGENGCGLTEKQLEMEPLKCAAESNTRQQWLEHACFSKELYEPEIKMTIELAAMMPTHKKVPECRLMPDSYDDFFISRILAVDKINWTPILSLMQQLSQLYLHIDFGLLGTKLAKYVENHPTCGVGLLTAGWWCGAGGRGACAARCLAAAHAHLPVRDAPKAMRQLAALLYLQSKPKDALDIAYLSFYSEPQGEVEAGILGLLQALNGNSNEAIWMYRYALTFNKNDPLALSCVRIEMCKLYYEKKLIEFEKNPDQVLLTMEKDPLILIS